MSPPMNRAGVAGLAVLLSLSPASRAADWNGSYAADGRCYCSGTIEPRLASRIVPTPRGGQSVARVCGRIGPGPGLSFVNGRFDRVVYEDVQCGHGPFAADASPAEPDCAGTMEPDSEDCRALGPRWDLTAIYARPPREVSADAASALIGAGVMGAPATVPVMGAANSATAAADPAVRIVEIDGRRWREAPLGTPETGPPGTRIILDGRVYLDVEQARAEDFLPRGGTSPRKAAAATPAPAPTSAPVRRRPAQTAATTTPDEPAIAPRSETSEPEAGATAANARPGTSAKELRARRERLLAEARERLRERAASEAEPEPEVAAASPIADAPKNVPAPTDVVVTPDRRIADAPTNVPAPTDVVVTPDRRIADAPTNVPAPTDVVVTPDRPTADAPTDRAADASTKGRRAAEEVADTLTAPDENGAGTSSALVRALRLPPATRASSREFGYVDAMPTSYDYGGGGMMLEGSAAFGGRFRALARIGAATDYQELLLGGSWFVTPLDADRLTVVLTTGVETGRFELEGSGVSTELSDTGLYLGAASRFVVNDRFELQAGVGYSSFFEGDPIAFGGGYYHIAPRLDVVSRVEVGDNDSLGIGVRYYY